MDLEGSMASFIADKPVNINRVTPTSRTKSLDLDRSNAAYLSASIDPPLEGYTEPVLIAGYLDYGEFGFGQGPKRHLTYTFNAQVRCMQVLTLDADKQTKVIHNCFATSSDHPPIQAGTGRSSSARWIMMLDTLMRARTS